MRTRLFVLSPLVGMCGCQSMDHACQRLLPHWQRPALVFTPKALPLGQKQARYEAEIVVSGNQTPVWGISLRDGGLPKGLILEQDRAQGGDRVLLHGIPQEAGTFTFTVEAVCFGTSRDGQVGGMTYRLLVQDSL